MIEESGGGWEASPEGGEKWDIDGGCVRGQRPLFSPFKTHALSAEQSMHVYRGLGRNSGPLLEEYRHQR